MTREGHGVRPYNLRRPPTQGVFQRTRDRLLSKMDKSWMVTQQSRGLGSRGNDCFRRVVLQAFLHQPAFCRWIVTHNVVNRRGRLENPCANMTVECVACAMKALVLEYWSAASLAANPHWLHWNSPALAELDRLADHSGRFLMEKYPPTNEQRACGQPGDLRCADQDDADGYYEWILSGVKSSVRYSRNLHFKKWEEQANALFRLNMQWTDTCPNGHVTVRNEVSGSDWGMRIYENTAVPGQAVIIEDEIEDAMNQPIPNVECTECPNGRATVNRRMQISSAPHILKITWTFYNAAQQKTFRSKDFGEDLILTNFQISPNTTLEYKLSSVIAHRGDRVDEGHFVATVKGPERIYNISDWQYLEEDMIFMTTDPQDVWTESDWAGPSPPAHSMSLTRSISSSLSPPDSPRQVVNDVLDNADDEVQQLTSDESSRKEADDVQNEIEHMSERLDATMNESSSSADNGDLSNTTEKGIAKEDTAMGGGTELQGHVPNEFQYKEEEEDPTEGFYCYILTYIRV